MFRKDYILQMVEDMVEMVGKVFGLKQQKKYAEALWEIDDLLSKNFRLNSKLLNSLSVEDMIDMFRLGGAIEADKLQSIARLLEEEGGVYLDMGHKDEGLTRLMKSLHLYLYADLHGADHSMLKLPERVTDLKEQLKGYRLPAKTDKLLLGYEEEQGHYDEAENALFRLLDQHEMTEEEGLTFYQRLLMRSDDELKAGGLPRAEVEEGVEELQRKVKG
ncbi:hypothetical protein J23TS9_55650 [Paenibacillus sp. J23TS9]|uniref:DUF6483 family protein n=1 Tax=Paenibacillus sp. J23TS9 TaxID=2807193 RepID=UPI001B0136A3|nr:DUF6483 family protein [Paenibacillus sp. J23TS9]GIP30435.1 hypothetical protein J23TS9_55650 [Paenibacillus sp. J23TS9]